MSELRTKLLDLAIQAGATIENAVKVATDWERWATEDDPLRLDVPSPGLPISERLKFLVSNFNLFPPDSVFILKNKSGEFIEMHGSILSDHDFTGVRQELLSDETWCLEKVGRRGRKDERLAIPDFMAKLDDEPKNLGNPEHEIDWSRPQLLISDKQQIVKTNGDHDMETFSGAVVSCGKTPYNPGHFSILFRKKDFVYHGEIPIEPKNLGKTEQETDWSRPQLLVSTDGVIIESTGRLNAMTPSSYFYTIEGYEYDMAIGRVSELSHWYCDQLKYHGEIPSQQPKESQCVNAKDGDGTCGLSCCTCAKEEPKTTGLTS